MPPAKSTDATILTVSQITARIRAAIEGGFPRVAVEGEIGNWSIAPSGHVYFNLKDEGALLSCVMWKGTRERLAFAPREGDKVVCEGRLSVFDKRGQYQLTTESMRKSGEGELWAQFQLLKQRLEKEGLFDPARKRRLPFYPTGIGIVTSPTGAVIRDILNITGRRAPSVPVYLYPARVQGKGAAAEIAHGIRRLAASGLVDVLIVGRGGGSLEDLWEFNSEEVARAVHDCPIPVVSAVGHEVDFTICDFVADLRAPTPSAAAELVSQGFFVLQDTVRQNLLRARRAVDGDIRQRRLRLDAALRSYALRSPQQRIDEMRDYTDRLLKEARRTLRDRTQALRSKIERSTAGIEGHNPALILSKGYAIIRKSNGKVLTKAAQLKKNMIVDLELADGKRGATITDGTAEDLFSL